METPQVTRLGRADEKREERRREARVRKLLILLLLLLLLLFSLLFAYLAIYGDLFERFNKTAVKPLFSIYGFERPLAVSSDAGGNIYASDTGNSRLLIYNPQGRYIRKIEGTKKFERFYGLIGSYPDSKSGKLFVADFRARAIDVYQGTSSKRTARWPKAPGAAVFGPLGFSPFAITMYRDELYVVSNDGVYVFSKQGKLLKKWNGRGSELGQWDYPIAIAVGKDGTMFVADQLNRRVVAMDRKGVIKWALGQPDQLGKAKSFFGLPRGVALDDEGRLFISDTFHHEIVVVTQAGKLIGVIGQRGVEDGKLNFPEGIAFTPDDVLLISDRENNRVQAWRVNSIRKPDKAMLKRYKTFFRQPKG